MTSTLRPTAAALQATLNDYWSRRARSYYADQQRPGRRDLDRRVWSQIWQSALPSAPARVADLGTGSGHVAWLLHDLGHRVTGVDAAAGMIDQARAHRPPGGRAPAFVVGDAHDPPLPEQSADAVTARYLLWTLRDPVAALRAWRRILRPGGVLAVVDALWFPDGLPSAPEVGGSVPEAASGDSLAEHFSDAYRDAGTDGVLPLATADTIEVWAEAVRAAGFTGVRTTPLTAVYDLDVRHGVPAGHCPTLQYLIRAVAP